VVAEHIGFSVWSIWSVMVLFMPEAVYGFSAGDKFLLGATATLVGGCLRIPYTLATATFGGRNWTVFSAFVLLIPTVGTMLCSPIRAFRGGRIWCALPWPTTATLDVDRMPQRLSSGHCRNVASCEAPITVCSPSPPAGCERFADGERPAGT